MMHRTTVIVVCTFALAVSAFAATPPATPPADTLKVDYFANANTALAPDGTVRSAGGGVCANVYVFDVNQEMSECCSCYLSPDGLRTLSVNVDLTSNPLTGHVLTTGVIKLVSNVATSTVCPLPTKIDSIFGGVRAWATHIQNNSFVETEGASQDATLSAAEDSRLNSECSGISISGSGSGICTCGTGD
jgi:hypothetical protein